VHALSTACVSHVTASSARSVPLPRAHYHSVLHLAVACLCFPSGCHTSKQTVMLGLQDIIKKALDSVKDKPEAVTAVASFQRLIKETAAELLGTVTEPSTDSSVTVGAGNQLQIDEAAVNANVETLETTAHDAMDVEEGDLPVFRQSRLSRLRSSIGDRTGLEEAGGEEGKVERASLDGNSSDGEEEGEEEAGGRESGEGGDEKGGHEDSIDGMSE
jgi:hypothetical protein